jgi:hypothetical protein
MARSLSFTPRNCLRVRLIAYNLRSPFLDLTLYTSAKAPLPSMPRLSKSEKLISSISDDAKVLFDIDAAALSLYMLSVLLKGPLLLPGITDVISSRLFPRGNVGDVWSSSHPSASERKMQPSYSSFSSSVNNAL